jgi:hypothetical protein
MPRRLHPPQQSEVFSISLLPLLTACPCSHQKPPPEWRRSKLPAENLDALVEQFGRAGFFSILNSSRFPVFPKGISLAEQVRISVFTGIALAECAANWNNIRIPEYRCRTKRFLQDLELIAHLIERNHTLDGHATEFSLQVRSPSHARNRPCEDTYISDDTTQLQWKLGKARDQIKSYLNSFEPRREARRNLDPLSYTFMEHMHEVWAVFRPYPEYLNEERAPYLRLPQGEFRAFAKFLAAAWRDGGLPLETRGGSSREPLEDWFADRLRKDRRFVRNLPNEEIEANSMDS